VYLNLYIFHFTKFAVEPYWDIVTYLESTHTYKLNHSLMLHYYSQMNVYVVLSSIISLIGTIIKIAMIFFVLGIHLIVLNLYYILLNLFTIYQAYF
jgi:hypothetical protein